MSEQSLTYSEQTKRSLAQTYPKKDCCRHALACGIYLCSRPFAQSGSITEPDWLCALLSHLKHQTDLAEVGALFTGERQLADLCRCEQCLPSFLRGAFLCCATTTDPARGYHLEFSVAFPRVIELLDLAMTEAGFAPRRTARRNQQTTLYFKDGETIADFFAYIGAQREAFSMMNTRIERDLWNRANRRKNCDTANIDKMIQAAQAQIEAIGRLERHDLLRHLPESVQETARLRCENPELTLQELAALHREHVTKSGINHRLQRMIRMAQELPSDETREGAT